MEMAVGVFKNFAEWTGNHLCWRLFFHKVYQSTQICGVLQGSILGPMLFNLYVTDMSTFTSSTCLHFADDTTLYKRCKVKDIPDCANMTLFKTM